MFILSFKFVKVKKKKLPLIRTSFRFSFVQYRFIKSDVSLQTHKKFKLKKNLWKCELLIMHDTIYNVESFLTKTYPSFYRDPFFRKSNYCCLLLLSY